MTQGQYNRCLPMVEERFAKLQNENVYSEMEKYNIVQVCNCERSKDLPLDQCPHMQNEAFYHYYTTLPLHLAHLNLINPENKEQIMNLMYGNIVRQISKHCQQEHEEDGEDQQLLLPNCHILEDLRKLFPQQIKDQNDPKKVQKSSRFRAPNIIIQLSFYSNILLLILKVVAFIVSKSMSILASLMDSLMDILSGLVLFIANRMAQKGIEKGSYQMHIHYTSDKIKTMYAQRYDSLGLIAFSSVMATVALMLIGQSIQLILQIRFNGGNKEINFGALPMSIIIFTIVLKFILCISAHVIAQKNKNDQYDTVTAYRDDHRNDVLTNILGFIGAALTYYLGDAWAYADPTTSCILSIYIAINWFFNGKEQLQNISGKQVDQQQLDQYMMILLHSFPEIVYIQKINKLIAYRQGPSNVIELVITISDVTVNQMHDTVQSIQTQFEQQDEIERCYVHVESNNSLNDF